MTLQPIQGHPQLRRDTDTGMVIDMHLFHDESIVRDFDGKGIVYSIGVEENKPWRMFIPQEVRAFNLDGDRSVKIRIEMQDHQGYGKTIYSAPLGAIEKLPLEPKTELEKQVAHLEALVEEAQHKISKPMVWHRNHRVLLHIPPGCSGVVSIKGLLREDPK
jgi:hypothetical protein